MSETTVSQSPFVEMKSFDELWFQVSGTLCNLECAHCFISCSPHNDSFTYLTLETVKKYLDESVAKGVKEYYFTGGEPFLNREILPILELALQYGPVTVLTNGTVLKAEWLERLWEAEQGTDYSLEFRVSIDGPTPETNNPIRGERTFERAMNGVRLLVQQGFLPIITMTRTWDESEELSILSSFRKVLAEHDCHRPRLKVLPRLQIGAEAERTEGYGVYDHVTNEMMQEFDETQLICSHSRVVTNKGIVVCPILLEAPDALLGQSLDEATVPFALSHGACYTCFQYGAICTNSTISQEG